VRSAEERVLAAALAGDVAETRSLVAAEPALVEASDAYDKTPLHLAAEHDHAELADVLIAAGAELEAETTWGMTPLEWAATVGSVGVGSQLVDAGARLDLYAAAGLGLADRVRGLEGDTAAVSRALQVGARNGHVPVVAALLERGGNIDQRGYFGGTGLHWAAINGHAEMVSFLLERGADAGIIDEQFGADALGWAREGGDAETIALLERSG
jgi:ankyrin repeat protein